MLVAVFDTSVLFSAVGWRGKPYRCLEMARSSAIEGLTSEELLNELTDTLETKLSFTSEQLTDTVADLLEVLRLVDVADELQVIAADPKDNKVLECAVAGVATHIITSDKKHLLPLGSYKGIQIVSLEYSRVVIDGPRSREAAIA